MGQFQAAHGRRSRPDTHSWIGSVARTRRLQRQRTPQAGILHARAAATLRGCASPPQKLRSVLGTQDYRIALELLTEAAIGDGKLCDDIVDRYREGLAGPEGVPSVSPSTVEDVLRLLEHDGYLERQEGGYRFVSGLLEDWWLARHGRHFVSIARRA